MTKCKLLQCNNCYSLTAVRLDLVAEYKCTECDRCTKMTEYHRGIIEDGRYGFVAEHPQDAAIISEYKIR